MGQEYKNVKLFNKKLLYLLNNDENFVISKSGIKIRKALNPLFRSIMMLSTNGELIMNKKKVDTIKKSIPKDKRIICAATHEYHDDIICSMKTMNRHMYLLYGSLIDFFESIHGIGLWVNGVILVDRKNKDSRKSAIKKMEKAIELGSDIIMFPEGTWNKQENKAVQKLYTGIYNVAETTGALIVPLATLEGNKKNYANLGDAYDITDFNMSMATEVINQQLKKIKKSIDLLIYNTKEESDLKIELYELLKYINDNLNKNDVNSNDLIFLSDIISDKLTSIIFNIKFSNEKDCLNEDILNRVLNLLKTASKEKKIIAVSHLRDKMCTLKWELYKNESRNKFKSNYWEEVIKKRIDSTKGLYDHSVEDFSEYKDSDEINEREVFSKLDNINETNANAVVLALTKNK